MYYYKLSSNLEHKKLFAPNLLKFCLHTFQMILGSTIYIYIYFLINSAKAWKKNTRKIETHQKLKPTGSQVLLVDGS